MRRFAIRTARLRAPIESEDALEIAIGAKQEEPPNRAMKGGVFKSEEREPRGKTDGENRELRPLACIGGEPADERLNAFDLFPPQAVVFEPFALRRVDLEPQLRECTR